MPINRAAWLTKSQKSPPLEVKDAPYTKPNKGEVVVEVHAVAINPIDWLKAGKGYSLAFLWIKLPFIQGTDLAGEVVEVGSEVSRLKTGDRVLSFGIGWNKHFNTSTKSAFQRYVVCLDYLTTPIPDSVPYEEASVVPLGAVTAAVSLFQTDQLSLQYPSPLPKATGKTVLIWGGSTSVGCNAIQLAKAAGYEVVTTCSPKNFALCTRLGAQSCFDYRSKSVVADLVDALNSTDFAGAMSAGINSDGPCLEVVSKCKGRKFISMVSFPRPDPESVFMFIPRMILFLASWFIVFSIKTKFQGVTWKPVMVDDVWRNGIGKAVFSDYLPKALQDGSFVTAPEPEVVGRGLESVSEAYKRQERGMSAKKAVVSLWK